jgi:hypothetical protein
MACRVYEEITVEVNQGGPNRVNVEGAGNNNVLDQNDDQCGTVRSSGSAYPNWVGPAGSYPCSLNNQDGSLVLYEPMALALQIKAALHEASEEFSDAELAGLQTKVEGWVARGVS